MFTLLKSGTTASTFVCEAKHRAIAVFVNVRERPEKVGILKILEVKDGLSVHKMETCFGD